MSEEVYSRKNPKWFTLWIVTSIALLTVGYLLGVFIKSPLDQAQVNSVTPQIATARVTEREFQPQIVSADGELTRGATHQVTDLTTIEGQKPIVTQHTKQIGQNVESGDVIIYISGQPVFALNIPFPLYRDLTPGVSGQDVQALQKELQRLGHYQGNIDGVYGTNTSQAVRKLFQSSGLTPPSPDSAIQEALTQAQNTLIAAQNQSIDSQDSGSVQEHQNHLSELKQQLTEAQIAADTPLPARYIIQMSEISAEIVGLPTVGATISGTESGIQLLQRSAQVTGRMTVLQAQSLTVGTQVVVSAATNTMATAEGTISAVSDFQESNENNPDPGYDYTVTFATAPGEDLLSDNRVNVTPAGGKAPQKGLAVPVTAIYEDATGKYVLTASDAKAAQKDAERKRVSVEVEMQQDGYVLIISKNDLKVGDLIAIGVATHVRD